jgi:glucosamine--fructose-6-phosphate aminotransferase (isomerizing)
VVVTNVVGSTAAREFEETLFIRSGPEIGVAATKTFTSQVASLLLLGERLVRDLTGSPSPESASLLADLADLPDHIEQVLEESPVEAVTRSLSRHEAFFFIGRGVAHPVAMEGALKFKEITYEHAEGFAAGELKHGPLALVTPTTPVFAILTGHHPEKTLGNIEEIKARGAPVVAVTNEVLGEVSGVVDECLTIPAVHPDVAGIVANVQLQLVAYHMANLLNRSIDKPRNLAKSVTVQ